MVFATVLIQLEFVTFDHLNYGRWWNGMIVLCWWCPGADVLGRLDMGWRMATQYQDSRLAKEGIEISIVRSDLKVSWLIIMGKRRTTYGGPNKVKYKNMSAVYQMTEESSDHHNYWPAFRNGVVGEPP